MSAFEDREEGKELFTKVVKAIREDFRRLRQLSSKLRKDSVSGIWVEDVFNDLAIELDNKIKTFCKECLFLTYEDVMGEYSSWLVDIIKEQALKCIQGERYIHFGTLLANLDEWEKNFNHTILPRLKENILKQGGYADCRFSLKNNLQYFEFATGKQKYIPPQQDEIEELLIKIRQNAYKDPGTVHNDYRTALNQIVNEFFGVDVTKMNKLIEITGKFGYPTDSSLYDFYDQGSQKQHQGKSSGSIDAIAAATAIEEYYKILKSDPPNGQIKQEIKENCEKQNILFRKGNEKSEEKQG